MIIRSTFLGFNHKITLKLLLVGGLNPLKNMKVNWDDEIPNLWENKIDGNQTTNQAIELRWWLLPGGFSAGGGPSKTKTLGPKGVAVPKKTHSDSLE